jgi:hypothetical protein
VGGELTLSPSRVRIRLDNEHRAVLPDIRLVDARGTLAGWSVRARTNADVRALLAPSNPRVIDGDNAGTGAGVVAPLHAGVLLGRAPVGAGGGTFRLGGEIRARSSATREFTIDLEVTPHG